ncbi:hypothetical protein Lal_00007703 [Lupinus albus]|nr:hypothetical protein Lal_00007703 [Lupinus albus]
MWMLLERVRFTLDGIECNKIGVNYEAFNQQPNFCSSPFWSCLHNQLWNFREGTGSYSFSIGITEVLNTNIVIELSATDVEYVYQSLLCCSEARIRETPSRVGVGHVSETDTLRFVMDTYPYLCFIALLYGSEEKWRKSPGKILGVSIPTFEALTQFGVATITTKNTGEVEASYSLTCFSRKQVAVLALMYCGVLQFNCSKDVTLMEEQYLIMKPNEITTRAFKIYPNTDQASKYFCAAILKDSDYGEVDRAECQFTTTGMVLDNGTQCWPPDSAYQSSLDLFQPAGYGHKDLTAVLSPKLGMPFQLPETSINGFFDSIESLWNKLWTSIIEFITGKICGQKCSGFFDFKCHIQYVCLSWVVMFGLFLAIFPTVLVLLWLLHQKGVFDPLYDWWEDIFGADEQTFVDKRNLEMVTGHHHTHSNKRHKQEHRHPKHGTQYRRRISYEHKHRHSERDSNHFDYLHHVQKETHKHSHKKNIVTVQHHGDNPAHYKHRKEGDTSKGLKLVELKHHKERQEKYDKHHGGLLYEPEDE